ncbi:MAG: hypothetical protein ACRD0C_09670 [Acidimicrobiia bacterium]
MRLRLASVRMVAVMTAAGTLVAVPATAEPGCNQKYADPVPGGQYFSRGEGSSITFGGGINVVGFSGSVTSTVSSYVKYKWTNTVGLPRNLCGESDYLTKNTRVRSME